MKKKNPIVKKVFLGILIAILAFILVRICVTEIYAHKIPHRFASAEEGKTIQEIRQSTETQFVISRIW